jgi:hypothetical protein
MGLAFGQDRIGGNHAYRGVSTRRQTASGDPLDQAADRVLKLQSRRGGSGTSV